MSVDAIRWAWSAPVESSSQRIVLLALADRAGEEHTCWPSMVRVQKDTCLDIKTVKSTISKLIEMGLLADTGERKGATGRVRVLRLVGVNGREEMNPKTESFQKRNDSEIGSLNEPKNGSLNEPKNGTQNLSKNLPKNLSFGGDVKGMVESPKVKAWSPSLVEVNNRLRITTAKPITQDQLDAFVTDVSAWYAGKNLTDGQMFVHLIKWIVRSPVESTVTPTAVYKTPEETKRLCTQTESAVSADVAKTNAQHLMRVLLGGAA